MMLVKSFDTGEVVLNYAEGPDNGPPMLLIPGFSSNCARARECFTIRYRRTGREKLIDVSVSNA